MKQAFYFLYYFKCHNCQKEFRQTTAYSPSTNIAETYCVNCANLKFFSLSLKAQANNSSLFSNSINSNQLFKQPTDFEKTTNNLNNQIRQETIQNPNPQTTESIPKDKRITGRTKQLNLKVKEQIYWKLKELALKNKCLMTEMLEKALESYGNKTRNKSYEK